MKHTNYKDLLQYYIDNEYDVKENDPYNYIESITNDTYNEELINEIENHFNEEEMLHDLPTGVIKDMFVYYTKHSK